MKRISFGNKSFFKKRYRSNVSRAPFSTKWRRPSYRRYDFFDDFDDGNRSALPVAPKGRKIAEFKVKPFFDQTFPRYSIRLETKSYFGYVPLKLRDHAISMLEEVVEHLSLCFGAPVASILQKRETGEEVLLFQRTLPAETKDPKSVAFAKLLLNSRDVVRFPLARERKPTPEEWRKKINDLNQFFSDTRGNDLGSFLLFHSSRPEKLIRITKGSHFDPISPTFLEKESGLEAFLEQALTKNNIPFEKQKKVIFNDQVLTIPDFSIVGTRILVYCDGFEYHSSNQKMNIDRKQDRILQNLGFRVLRFTDSELENDVQSVIYEINETIRIENLR